MSIAAGLCLVHSAHQSSDHVRVLRTEIVARAKDVSRNRGNHLRTELSAVGSAQKKSGEFGDRVRFIRRFQFTGSQILDFHRLLGKLRVNAGAGKIEQLLNTVAVSALKHVTIYQQIVTHQIRRVALICRDTSRPPSDEKHITGEVTSKILIDFGSIGNFWAVLLIQKVFVTRSFELGKNFSSYEAIVVSHVDSCALIHALERTNGNPTAIIFSTAEVRLVSAGRVARRTFI